jgi:hypothetical protein
MRIPKYSYSPELGSPVGAICFRQYAYEGLMRWPVYVGLQFLFQFVAYLSTLEVLEDDLSVYTPVTQHTSSSDAEAPELLGGVISHQEVAPAP